MYKRQQFIINNYDKLPYAKIAEKIGKDARAIANKVYALRKEGIIPPVQHKKKPKSGNRPKYPPAVVCNDRNCQDCEYGIKEEVGDAYWCEKLKKRVFPQEAMP